MINRDAEPTYEILRDFCAKFTPTEGCPEYFNSIFEIHNDVYRILFTKMRDAEISEYYTQQVELAIIDDLFKHEDFKKLVYGVIDGVKAPNDVSADFLFHFGVILGDNVAKLT